MGCSRQFGALSSHRPEGLQTPFECLSQSETFCQSLKATGLSLRPISGLGQPVAWVPRAESLLSNCRPCDIGVLDASAVGALRDRVGVLSSDAQLAWATSVPTDVHLSLCI